jgi:hypothetical protein
VTAPDPGRVLRRALVAWGLGHLLLGRATAGRVLLIAEAAAALAVAWLTIGLADSSLYLVPFLAGVTFIVAWAWQAVDAYRWARGLQPESESTPMRSPAAAIAWLSLPLLVWGTGFWLIGAHSGNPEAVLDRFVRDWSRMELAAGWPDDVITDAEAAAAALGSGPDGFRDIRVRIVARSESHATAVAQAIHFERRETRLLGVFPGTELVPVSDRDILTLELVARPVELAGGGNIGAVRWELVSADAD